MYLLRANNKYNTSLFQAAKVGDTVIYVNAIPANLPTEVTLDYGLSTEETVTVVSSGSNSLTLQSGQSLAYNHSIGAAVQCLNQADFLNIFATDFEQDHDQGGYHHIANFGLSDYVISGLTIPTGAGLSVQSTSGYAYITGKRISVASDGGHGYTANQDTYVDVDNTGAYHYQGVANGASAPSLTANSIRIAKVITNASAVATVVQFGADSNGVLLYPASPLQNRESVRNISRFGLNDYVVSGITAATSASLSTTFVAGFAYIKGYRISVPTDNGHTYTASQDTYVDVDWNGVYHYQGVANNSSAPSVYANSIRVAKVVTNGSAVTSVTQSGVDNINNVIYPGSPVQNIGYSQIQPSSLWNFLASPEAFSVSATGPGTLNITPAQANVYGVMYVEVSIPYVADYTGYRFWTGANATGTQIVQFDTSNAYWNGSSQVNYWSSNYNVRLFVPTTARSMQANGSGVNPSVGSTIKLTILAYIR